MKKTDLLIGSLIGFFILGTIKDIITLIFAIIVLRKTLNRKD